MYCSGCHTHVQGHWNFCPQCGKRLTQIQHPANGEEPNLERRLELLREHPPDVNQEST